jgi:cobalt transporter subunit CbtB
MTTASTPLVAPAASENKVERVGELFAIFAAILFGIVLIAGSGFAGPAALHNAAHDSRHANVFPCH